MPNLNTIEQRILEDYLQMGGGYVLDFTNHTFQQAMLDFCGVDIYADTYAAFGDSKAKRLRCFFSKGSNAQILKTISGLLDYAKACIPDRDQSVEAAIGKIIKRLGGAVETPVPSSEQDFLDKEFPEVDFSALSLEPSFVNILESRWKEVGCCMSAKAYLSAVIMTGSLLEAVLLGLASSNPSVFNQAKSTPRNEKNGKPKQFHEWNLASLIDVAFETEWIDLDVKKHSHSLRDFRNYIHPFEQKVSGFQPSKETLAIATQVFRAAIAQIKRKS